MQDLFAHEAQTADRDRSLTTAIIDRAIAAGYSVRIEDDHGDNKTLTTRSRAALLEAVGTSRATTFHIINTKADLGKNVGQVTVYHGDEADRITESIGRNGEDNEQFIASLTPTPTLAEIIDYTRQLAADDERREAAKKAAAGEIEIVPTSALREGDLIRCNGCTMQLGPIHESKSHKPDENGAVYWTRAVVIDEVGSHIPKSWLDVDAEGNRTWLVQGNDLAKWRRCK